MSKGTPWKIDYGFFLAVRKLSSSVYKFEKKCKMEWEHLVRWVLNLVLNVNLMAVRQDGLNLRINLFNTWRQEKIRSRNQAI